MCLTLRHVAITAACLMPPVNATAAPWTETILHAFKGPEGYQPHAGLIGDATGHLYGTTAGGGKFGSDGTIFRLNPPQDGHHAWSETLLHSFDGTKGENPQADLVLDAAGNLYGTNVGGGKLGGGTAFELSPPADGKHEWTETILHEFKEIGGLDVISPLVFDSAGNLYGTTYYGGDDNAGTVFRLSPPLGGKGHWSETVLLSFDGANGGAHPMGNIVFDNAGNLYGTTSEGGRHGNGIVFRLEPRVGEKTAWHERVLHPFEGTNGENPEGGLAIDQAGNLYGTTYFGGRHGFGLVFMLSPPGNGKTRWKETFLHGFNGTTNGRYPETGVVLDQAGNVYGTNAYGGRANVGTVFMLTPPSQGKTGWSFLVLRSLTGKDGAYPQGNLLLDNAGNVYGTTYDGGKSGGGIAFKLIPTALSSDL